jgi:drug/metabolite transporter (DMT)-like permease
MLGGCAAFTLMNTLVHTLRGVCDWQVIALFRAGLAFLFALILARAAGATLHVFRPASLWVRSIAGSISLVCCFFAMTREGAVSNVLAITNIFPIWVALLGWPLLGVRPGRAVLLSVVTAVLGVMLIRAPQFGDGGELLPAGDDATLATVFAFVASIATAVAMLGLNRLYWIDTRAVVAHFSGVATLFCVGALLIAGTQLPLEQLVQPWTIAMLLGVGVTATVGQICLTKAFTVGAPAKVSVVGLTQIVMTLAVDVLWFEQPFTLLNLAGIALVLVPTAWVILQGAARPAAKAAPAAANDKTHEPRPVGLKRLQVPVTSNR